MLYLFFCVYFCLVRVRVVNMEINMVEKRFWEFFILVNEFIVCCIVCVIL